MLTCIREKRTLATAGRLLAENAERHLKRPAAMAALFSDRPELLRNAEALAERLSFTLEDLGYRFPDYPVPAGESQFSYLCRVTDEGARERYRPYHEKARRQIERELALIGKLELAGYFLIVWDLVNFCRREGILVQGRGSAANSAVCYSLGITAVDPVGMELLFERFLSEERGEWPDIDLDLPSGDRRERVIQHVYERYGAAGAAMTANVITYRDRSASREIGKVLGIPMDEIDRLASHMRRFEYVDPDDTLETRLSPRRLRPRGPPHAPLRAALRRDPGPAAAPRPALGRHGDRAGTARRGRAARAREHAGPRRRAVGQGGLRRPRDHQGRPPRPRHDGGAPGLPRAPAATTGSRSTSRTCRPDDPKVYRMLREADTVGLFQVESRAQMATLPRMKPDHFYDLVVEVAIIRPGPIVGKMVHPYLARRNGEEPVTYPHPSLEPILKRTLGVPLFQEQLLRMAMTVAGFTGGEAEELRRAMGFKRSEKRMKAIEARLRAGMAERGITGEAQDAIVRSITSFALYGFPESHAASFALIAYASAYLKAHHGAAFLCALLNNQPMGFYHPFTLVKDAQRHGVRFRPVDVTRSGALCTLEEGEVRLGLGYVRGLRAEAARRIEDERARAPFASLQDFVDRTELRRDEQRKLAEVGRAQRLRPHAPQRAVAGGEGRPAARAAVPRRRAGGRAFAAAGHGPRGAPVERPRRHRRHGRPAPDRLHRDALAARGVLRACDLRGRTDGERVRVAGAVICRQRPGTAAGFMFLTLEDETGLANVIVRPDLFQRERAVLVAAPILEVDGVLQANDGLSVRAFAVRPAVVAAPAPPARQFH